MSKNIIIVDGNLTEDCYETGKNKLKNNEFLHDLSELMENKKFVKFFNTYMNDWYGVKSTVTYMKLYDEFKKKYKKISNKDLDKNIIVFMLCKIMQHKELRPLALHTIDDIYNGNKKDFFDEFDKHLKFNTPKLLKD